MTEFVRSAQKIKYVVFSGVPTMTRTILPIVEQGSLEIRPG